MISVWHWLIVLVAVSSIYPAGVVLKRLGFSPFWAMLVLIPVVNFIALWALGLAVRDRRNEETRKEMTFD
jgi:hypothetical protein